MMNFILGRSGSGKTAYIIDEIRKAVASGKRCLLLVPEQQTFISESMLADLPPSSALCFEVITFSRLCTKIFAEYGGLIDSSASGGERDLIMWQSIREISSQLLEYGRVKTDIAFCSMMLSAIDELHAGGITPEECERAAEECDDPELAKKLFDVALIYANFNRVLSTRIGEGAAAAENKLSRLCTLLREHDFFEGCHIFVDSFTSFTGEEHAILYEIASQADSFSITFCRDGESRNMPHTVGVDDTFRRFRKFANEKGLNTQIITLSGENKKDEALIALERGLWDFSLTKDSVRHFEDHELSPIEAYVCKNEYDEINLAAIKILQAVKEGTKFSEIAVILRDAESRKGFIDAVFSRLGIPYFISEKTDLSATAAARLVFSALHCVVYRFRSSDVMTLLKTGLCGVSEDDADLFEDYCYTWNISGAKFLDDVWSMNPDGYTADKPHGRSLEILQAANRVRAAIIPPLVRLRDKFSAAKGDTTANCRALYEYLAEIGLSKSLCTLAELDVAAGDLRAAGESLRVYDSIITAISRVCTILSDAPTTPEELSHAIEIILRGSSIGSVPSVGEYVTVGSAPTLRVENVKVAIVLGLCEGEFPRCYSDSGIFTECDKENMEKLSLPLVSRETRVTSDELFYVYRAMTKSRKKLIISTCTSKVGGGSATPSTAWNRVFFLFPNLKKYLFDLDLVKKIAEATGGDVESVSEEELQKIAAEESDSEPKTPEVTISPLQIKALFGDKIYLSQTKISTFASCPYQYWCKYVLALRERKTSAISYDSSGTIVHYVMEKLIGDLKQKDGSLSCPDDETLVKLVNGYVEQYIGSIGCELPSSMMYTFSRLRDLALVMAKSVIDEFADSSFKILAQELRISEEREGALKPLEINIHESPDSPKIILGGIIDRVDFFDGEDKRYIRIVDYKTGSHPFDIEALDDGTDVQLPAYLFTAALDKNKEIIGGEKEIFPASALFLSANESAGKVTPERSGFMLDDIELLRAASGELDKKILAGIDVDKSTGTIKKGNAVSEEGIYEIDRSLRESIACTGRSIFEGKAPRTPSPDACKYCFLRSGCPVAAKSTTY